MKCNLFTRSLVLTALLGVGMLPGQALRANDEKVLVFEKFVKPWIHDSLYLNVNGVATIDGAFLFNDKGYVDDWVPIRTNDMKLIQSINNVIGEWKIEPVTYNGEPSWSYIEFQIRFVNEGAVVSLTPLEAVISFTKSMRDDFHLVIPFRDLDSIPKPIHMETPRISPQLARDSSGETVTFEFFIDQKGKVRIPIIKEDYNTEELAAAIMLESLLKWEFEPPTRNGKAVITRAVIPFRIP
ncbi:MAG: hypothetical protein ABQ298_05965 [Puniceicoccaceae bacterium]